MYNVAACWRTVRWAIVGNIYARQLFVFPFWRAQFWNDIGVGIAWYLFLRKDPKMYLGHNPLAHFVTFFMITGLTTFMIATDPYLQRFVQEFTATNSGKAFFASLDKLGSFIFRDFESGKRKTVY